MTHLLNSITMVFLHSHKKNEVLNGFCTEQMLYKEFMFSIKFHSNLLHDYCPVIMDRKFQKTNVRIT